jgi:precorrin-2 dehydrogenase/sirohydrochlorin ferrochelatase
MPYPILLNISGRVCVVVGGGPVAERRVERMLAEHASVLVVAPELSSRLRVWADEGVVDWRAALYQPSHLDSAFLVLAATDDSAVNRAVVADALTLGLLVCSADSPDDGNYITPATVERGSLLLTVSTGGASPTLSAVIRRRLSLQFGPEWAGWIDLFRLLRTRVQQAGNEEQRLQVVEQILADRRTAEFVRDRDLAKAEEAARTCILSQSD